MIDVVVSARAAWLGGSTLETDVALGISDDRIAWIEAGDATSPTMPRMHVDGVLIPGLVDHHVHTALADTAKLFASGVTTVLDLGWVPDVIWPVVAESADGKTAVPRVLAAGPFLTAPGGYPTRQSWAPPGIAYEIDDPRTARRAVRSLALHRPVTIKVALNSTVGPVLDDPTLVSIVREARAHGIGVTAHVEGPGQARRAQRAGVRCLAHTPWSERLDDELIVCLARTTEIVSTIHIHGWGDDTPGRRTALDNLRRFHRAGGRVRYGTDLGNGPLGDGVNAGEIDALGQAGLSAPGILASISREGLVAGARADLAAVPTDPSRDPSALLHARPILKAGHVLNLTRVPSST